MLKVQIGIMSHKPGELLERCLESLIRIPAGINYELKLQLTQGSCAENWNRLWDKCDGDLICMIEDDTAALRPFWLKSLVETLMMYPKCGIVMPIESKDRENPDQGFMQWMNGHNVVPQVYGFCNLIRKKINIRADETLTYFTDIDIGYQTISQGYECMVNGHVMMLHGGDGKAKRMSENPDIEEIQIKDQEYLIDKWKNQRR